MKESGDHVGLHYSRVSRIIDKAAQKVQHKTPLLSDPPAQGGQDTVTSIKLVRHRQTKGAETDRLDLRARNAYFLLYPLFLPPLFRA